MLEEVSALSMPEAWEGLLGEAGLITPRARFGRPTVRLSRSRTATTRSLVEETPTSMAGHTRLEVSFIVKTRNHRPLTRLSVRKSMLHRS